MIDRIPIKTNPKMFDLAVSKIQNVLGSITWFDHVFGICEFLTDVKEGKKFTSANDMWERTATNRLCRVRH